MNTKKIVLALTCLSCCSVFTSASLYAGHHRKHKHRDKSSSEKRSPGERVDAAIDYTREKIEDAQVQIAEVKESAKETFSDVQDHVSEAVDSAQTSVNESVDETLSD